MNFRSAPTALAATALVAAGWGGLGPMPASSAAVNPTIPLLTIGSTFPEPTLDLKKSDYANLLANLSLETLLQFNPQGKLEPDLATSWSQTGPVTYVYNLRHGVKFWDGNELTAADVAYSLNYTRSAGSESAYGFQSVKSISASGPYKVVVTLTHPDASWQYQPADGNAEIWEMKFAEEHTGTFGKPGVLVMGTGPWIIDSLDPTTGAELSANPHWWGGTVPIQHISFKIFSNETSLALAMRAGEIDVDPYVLYPGSFKATSATSLISAASCGSHNFSMNTRLPGWDDVHVRRAVAYALNRSNIIAAEGGYATPNYTLITGQELGTIASPPQVNALFGSIPLYPYNLTKARAEMAQSAYPHGFSATLLEYDSGTSQVGEVIAAELQKIGIQAQVKDVGLNQWAAIESGPAPKRLATFSNSGCNSPDPSWYTYVLGTANLQSGQWNTADYAPPAVDKLISEGAGASSSAGRFAAYSSLLRRLASDVPYVPLDLEITTMAVSNKFAFTGFNQFSTDGAYALNIRPAR